MAAIVCLGCYMLRLQKDVDGYKNVVDAFMAGVGTKGKQINAETTENDASKFIKLKQQSKIRGTPSNSKQEQDQKRKNPSKSPVTGGSSKKKKKAKGNTPKEKKKMLAEKPNAEEGTSEKSVTQDKESV